MSDAETYLRELRRALPVGCRRRFVAEVREHFASAIAAEAENGVERGEAERLTIDRLGPARALAGQLRADLGSGALGRAGRLRASLTTARLGAAVGVIAIALVAGAAFAVTRSSPAQRGPLRTVSPTVTLDPKTGEVRKIVFAATQAEAKVLLTSRNGGPVLVQWRAATPPRP